MSVTVLEVATWLALASTCATVLLATAALQRRELEPWVPKATSLALALTLAPLVILALEFLTGSLQFLYIWRHTQLDYPWWLRLSGIWGGQQGTFLLWGAIVLGATRVEQHLSDHETWPRARIVLLVLAAVLLVPPVVLGLGKATAAFGLVPDGSFVHGASGPRPTDLRPMGEGLNPLLESPYMAVHPWIEFVAYGLTAVPFAYAVTHLSSGGRWQEGAERWARLAWIAFATALALGALWAYNVLSFGGYWAWDPVETGDLLPFLSLTIFLHGARVRQRSEHLGLLTPAMAALAFVLVVFATFITRGGLWSSVHAFLPIGTSVAIQDPGARLVTIVGDDTPARLATGLLLVVSGTYAGAASLYQARASPSSARARRGVFTALATVLGLVGLAGLLFTTPVVVGLHRLALLLGAGNPLIGALGLLVIGAAPVLLGILWAPEDTPLSPRTRMGQLTLSAYTLTVVLLATLVLLVLGVNGYDRSVYDARAPYLAAPILVLITLAFLPGRFQRRLWVVAGASALAVVAKLVTGSWAWAAAPLTLAAAAGPILDHARKAFPTGDRRARVRAALLLAAGVLGLIHWASPGALVVAGTALASPLWYVPVGLAAAILTMLSPYLEERVPAWLGPVAGVLAVGYGLGAVLAVLAWWVRPGRVPGPRARLGKAGVPLIHLGVALLVLGVAASTFGQTITTYRQADPIERGVPVTVGDYEVELVDGRVVDEDDQAPIDRVEAVVHVSKGGVFVSEETLVLEHSFNTGFTGRGSYVPQDAQVSRGWSGDLVLDAEPAVPLSIRVRGTNTTWYTANAPPPDGGQGQVDAISLGVASTPLVNLVWGSVPLLLVGASIRLRRAGR